MLLQGRRALDGHSALGKISPMRYERQYEQKVADR